MRVFRPNGDMAVTMHAQLDKALRKCAFENSKSITLQIPDMPDAKKQAVVTFGKLAWQKIRLLVEEYDVEIAWHATVCRTGEAEYFVDDILIYPQSVSPCCVRTDVDKKEVWRESLDEETFNAIHLQGHSHVRMGVTPSSQGYTSDIHCQKQIASQIKGDDFYIFMITNKLGDMWLKIFDAQLNIVFENPDIVYSIEDEYGFDRDHFLEETHEVVEEQKQKPKPVQSYLTESTALDDEYPDDGYDDVYDYYKRRQK